VDYTTRGADPYSLEYGCGGAIKVTLGPANPLVGPSETLNNTLLFARNHFENNSAAVFGAGIFININPLFDEQSRPW